MSPGWPVVNAPGDVIRDDQLNPSCIIVASSSGRRHVVVAAVRVTAVSSQVTTAA